MRTNSHFVRRGTCAAALALVATGVVSAPALAATATVGTLAPSDGVSNDGFGEGVGISSNGGVTAVGSPGHDGSGAVYVFTGTGTAFSQTAELSPSTPVSGEDFGKAVAMSGDGETLVVGAEAAGTDDQGAAYVFADQNGTWTQIAQLTASGTVDLGTSVAISADGSTIVVGAPFSDGENGEAIVYTKSGSTYVQTQVLNVSASVLSSTKVTAKTSSLASAARQPKPKPTPTPTTDLLGFSTALSSNGSTIVLGAPGTNGFAGAADVFTKPVGASAWTQTASLTGSNIVANDDLGIAVAVSSTGTTVAAGAPNTNGANGSIYVFTGSGSTFTQAGNVLPPAGLSEAESGSSLGMSSDGSVIAFASPTGTDNEGAVYVAAETDGAWALTATDTQPNPTVDNNLGFGNGSVAVAGNGSVIVAGAAGVNNDTGAAFAFPVN